MGEGGRHGWEGPEGGYEGRAFIVALDSTEGHPPWVLPTVLCLRFQLGPWQAPSRARPRVGTWSVHRKCNRDLCFQRLRSWGEWNFLQKQLVTHTGPPLTLAAQCGGRSRVASGPAGAW